MSLETIILIAIGVTLCVGAAILVIAACRRSSQISQEEERNGG